MAGPGFDPYCLVWGCDRGHLDVIEVLLEAFSDSIGNSRDLVDDIFRQVCERGLATHHIVRLFLEHLPSTPKNFVYACSLGSISLVIDMLREGMDADGDECES